MGEVFSRSGLPKGSPNFRSRQEWALRARFVMLNDGREASSRKGSAKAPKVELIPEVNVDEIEPKDFYER